MMWPLFISCMTGRAATGTLARAPCGARWRWRVGWLQQPRQERMVCLSVSPHQKQLLSPCYTASRGVCGHFRSPIMASAARRPSFDALTDPLLEKIFITAGQQAGVSAGGGLRSAAAAARRRTLLALPTPPSCPGPCAGGHHAGQPPLEPCVLLGASPLAVPGAVCLVSKPGSRGGGGARVVCRQGPPAAPNRRLCGAAAIRPGL